MDLTTHLNQQRAEDRKMSSMFPGTTPAPAGRYYALMVQDQDGYVFCWATADYTQADREALQAQADSHPGRAWVQTEWGAA